MVLFLFSLASSHIKLQSTALYKTKSEIKHWYLWYLFPSLYRDSCPETPQRLLLTSHSFPLWEGK